MPDWNDFFFTPTNCTMAMKPQKLLGTRWRSITAAYQSVTAYLSTWPSGEPETLPFTELFQKFGFSYEKPQGRSSLGVEELVQGSQALGYTITSSVNSASTSCTPGSFLNLPPELVPTNCDKICLTIALWSLGI